MSLRDCSIEELEAELDRRNNSPEIPPLPNPDFTKLIRCVQECVQQVVVDGYDDDDNTQYVYEEALQAIYGDDIFEKLNRFYK